MSREDRKNRITELCERAGCSDKLRKIHFEQYVDRHWNPHPSDAFRKWWSRHPDCGEGIDVKRAYNCKRYVDEFFDARKIGTDLEWPQEAEEIIGL